MPKFEIHPLIKEAIRHNSLILFIGSGYSRNINLPTWNGLAKRTVDELFKNDKSLEALKDEASKDGMVPIKILDTLFEKGHDTECKKILKDIIDIDLSKYDLRNQEKIWRISEKVITTNYDKALESALDEDLREKVEVLVPEEKRHTRISILTDESYLYKIHGTIDRPETCVLFSADYDQLYKYNHAFLTELKRLSANSVILFIGYSISDIEIQKILGNINSLFHVETKHFIVTPDVKEFKNIGIGTIKIENYTELLPYLDELVSYRQEIEGNYSAIEERVNAKYKGMKDLLSSFEKENTLYAEKETFKRQEDRKDILQLQLLNADPVVNESVINGLKAEGKGEQLKDYLLLKREASRLQNRAYFEHVETGKGEYLDEASIEANLKAMEIAKQVFGGTDKETINLYNEIGQGYIYKYDFENAEYYFNEGLQLVLKTGEDKFLAGCFYSNLGNVEIEKKNLEKAMNYYQQALNVKQENGDETEGEIRDIAKTLLSQKKYNEAKKIYKQILQKTKAPILFTADTYQALGLTHVRLGEHGDAIKCYEQALSLFFDYYGKENKEFIIFYNDIGYSYFQEKRYEKAITYYKKVIALEQNTEKVFIAMNNIGEAYYNAEQFEEAKAAFDESLVFLEQKGPSEPEYPEAYEYCRKQIKLCREKMERGERGKNTGK